MSEITLVIINERKLSVLEESAYHQYTVCNMGTCAVQMLRDDCANVQL